jgi:two-component system response regulator FixJ
VRSPEIEPAPLFPMPTATNSPVTVPEGASEVCGFGNGPVYVLDDDVSMLKALDRLLKSDGFEVAKFSEAAPFLSALGTSCCRVAILDVWMPEMNGLEVQAKLRRQSPATRIIFMSGRDDPSVRHVALEAGAFGFLSKPFDDAVLLQLVRDALSS